MMRPALSLPVLLLTASIAACSTQRTAVPPEARACMSSERMPRMADENERLRALRSRAEAFDECMRAHGFTLNEEALEAELLRFEQIRNADSYGVDPRMAIDIREQELRLSPAYWQPSARR